MVKVRWMSMAACAGMLLWKGAHAALPTVSTHMAADGFDSPLAAIQDAGGLYLEKSRRSDREYVGGVLRDPHGRYVYTAGRSAAGADRVRFRIERPRGHTLVAFWHTHGRRGPGRELFSEEDTRLVVSRGFPLYLITPSGRIRVLRPGGIRPLRTRESALALRGAARGVIVGRLR